MVDTFKQRRHCLTEGGHWLKKRIDSGKSIQLEDDSLWQVNPSDRIACSVWLHTQKIAVAKSKNPSHPYFLINMDAEEKVEAKLILG